MNQIILMGRLTRDPELKSTNSGIEYCKFTLAVDRRFSNANGEKQTDFFNCTAWRGTATFVAKYFGKGQKMAVAGSMQTDKFTDKDGNNRTAYDVNVEQAEFCESRKSQGIEGDYAEEAVGEAELPFDL